MTESTKFSRKRQFDAPGVDGVEARERFQLRFKIPNDPLQTPLKCFKFGEKDTFLL